MDCCNFPPEYRAQYGWGEAYGGAYGQPYGAPAPTAVPYSYAAYASYAPDYAAPEQYARFSSYHYGEYPPAPPPPPHRHHADHALLEYGGGGYVSKEGRTRRALARREAERARARTPATAAVAPPHHHMPLPHAPTPPLECGGVAGRVPGGYCDPHMSWQHYQMGGGGGGWGGGWSARGGGGGGGPLRDPLRHLAAMHDHCNLRSLKGQNMSMLEQMAAEGRASSTPFSPYEEASYGSPRPRSRLAPEYVDYAAAAAMRRSPARSPPPPPPPPPPAPVPLPAFQQAFGSTEIGRFAEAFSRAEAAHGLGCDAAPPEPFAEWDAAEPAWPPPQPPPPPHAARTIKCEEPY